MSVLLRGRRSLELCVASRPVVQVVDLVEARVRADRIKDRTAVLNASELHSYLGRVFYNRRNKMNPYWNSILVAGIEDGVPYDC